MRMRWQSSTRMMWRTNWRWMSSTRWRITRVFQNLMWLTVINMTLQFLVSFPLCVSILISSRMSFCRFHTTTLFDTVSSTTKLSVGPFSERFQLGCSLVKAVSKWLRKSLLAGLLFRITLTKSTHQVSGPTITLYQSGLGTTQLLETSLWQWSTTNPSTILEQKRERWTLLALSWGLSIQFWGRSLSRRQLPTRSSSTWNLDNKCWMTFLSTRLTSKRWRVMLTRMVLVVMQSKAATWKESLTNRLKRRSRQMKRTHQCKLL